jgi:hypothetical protein
MSRVRERIQSQHLQSRTGHHVLAILDCLDGGTFTLNFLLYRHTNVSLLPNRQVVVDEEFSTYKLEYPLEVADKSCIKELLEKHKKLHAALLVMVDTYTVIGDDFLTLSSSAKILHPCTVVCLIDHKSMNEDCLIADIWLSVVSCALSIIFSCFMA